MKVSELAGPLLDLWVAKADKKDAYIHSGYCFLHSSSRDWHRNPGGKYSPSTDWAQGGPLIERGRIFSRFVEKGFLPMLFENKWVCHYKNGSEVSGDTQLIAAMRCFVALKFGDEVPDE